MHCSRRLIVQTLVFSRSYLHRQASPPETLVVKGGTTWARNGLWILPENARLPRNIQGSFTCRKSTTWDKRLCFPSEGMRAEDFFALKNSTASAGFEPHRTWVPKASTLPLDHWSRYSGSLIIPFIVLLHTVSSFTSYFLSIFLTCMHLNIRIQRLTTVPSHTEFSYEATCDRIHTFI